MICTLMKHAPPPHPVHCSSLVGSSQSIVFISDNDEGNDDDDDDGGGSGKSSDHDHDDDDDDDLRAGQRPMIARELRECHIDYQHRIPPRDTFSHLSLTCSNFHSITPLLPLVRSIVANYTFVLHILYVARQQ